MDLGANFINFTFGHGGVGGAAHVVGSLKEKPGTGCNCSGCACENQNKPGCGLGVVGACGVCLQFVRGHIPGGSGCGGVLFRGCVLAFNPKSFGDLHQGLGGLVFLNFVHGVGSVG
jgi:hypothetical protein